jgi:hypothetical protein
MWRLSEDCGSVVYLLILPIPNACASPLHVGPIGDKSLTVGSDGAKLEGLWCP